MLKEVGLFVLSVDGNIGAFESVDFVGGNVNQVTLTIVGGANHEVVIIVFIIAGNLVELFNANRCAIELQCGRRVGQLVFAQMDDSALNPYNGKYQGQKGATGSKVFMDMDNVG